MTLVALVAGVALLGVALIDLLWTTLWVSGRAGPLTGRISALAWATAVRVFGDHHGRLSLLGPLTVVCRHHRLVSVAVVRLGSRLRRRCNVHP